MIPKIRVWDGEKIIYNVGLTPEGIAYTIPKNAEDSDQFDYYPDCPIMHYTGLMGKNGKEIYEGDIVEFNDFDSLRTGGHTEDNILQGNVIFSWGAWIVKTDRGHHDLYTAIVNDEEIEIIGNKFTNPELLK